MKNKTAEIVFFAVFNFVLPLVAFSQQAAPTSGTAQSSKTDMASGVDQPSSGKTDQGQPSNGQSSDNKTPALTPEQERAVNQAVKQLSGNSIDFAGKFINGLLAGKQGKGATDANVHNAVEGIAKIPNLVQNLRKDSADVKTANKSIDRLLERKSDLGPFEVPFVHIVERVVNENGAVSKEVDLHLLQKVADIAERYPENPEAHEVLGSLRSDVGDYKGAVQDFTAALAIDPVSKDALQGRSGARYELGNYPGAVRDAQALLRVEPGNKAAIVMLQLIGGRTRPSETIEIAAAPQDAPADPVLIAGSVRPHPPIFDRVVPTSPAESQSAQYAKEAASSLDVGDFAKAVHLTELAIKLNPHNAQAYDYQAIAFVRSGKYDQALESVDQGLQVLPKNPVLTVTKAFAFNRVGRFAEAKRILQNTSSFDGAAGADVSYNLAYAEAGLGNRRAMLNALGRASDLDPGRFGQAYEMAVQAPDSSDLTYLFGGGLPNAVAAGSLSPHRGLSREFIFFIVALLVGVLLTAAGLFHTMAPHKSRTAIQRLMDVAVDGNQQAKRLISGTYKVIRQIGSGGMGTVYEAVDLNLHRSVALKKMRTEIRQDERERRRFLNEARTVAALHHPNIVEIYSIIEDPSDICLVFEYVEGKNLNEILAEQGPLSFDLGKLVFRGVCRALEYAHSHRVIHQDLKPSNIMITRWGTLKVMDFGIAREVQEAVSRLMTNTVTGTPPYMAPELEQGLVGKEADVYSLGVCLYELLSGQVPFAGTGSGLLHNKKKMDFKPLSSLVKNLPSGIDDVILGALQADPAKRIKTPAQFFMALGH